MRNKMNNQSITLRYSLGVLLMILSNLSVWGQDMKIESVESYPTNYANTEGFIVMDPYNSDQKTTLIIVDSPTKGLILEAGSCQVIQRIEKEGETWFYLQANAKHLRIKHKDLKSTPEFKLASPLLKARTYILSMTSAHVQTMSFDPDKSQYLQLSVYPSSAKVIIDGQRVRLKDGQKKDEYQLGIHNYLITDPMYHSREGQIILDGKDSVKMVFLRLKQAYGWLKIDSKELSDANILIDDSLYAEGSIMLPEFKVLSGNHTVKIAKKLKAVWQQNIAIQDSLTTIVKPVFIDDYANISFTTDKEADIYVDGEFKGKGTWQGDLGAGNHLVECRRDAHRTTSRTITVVKNRNEKITLDRPTPIYANITVTSEPIGADVYLDGIKIGVTPLVDYRNALIGEHRIKVEKSGYRIEETTKVLAENEPFVWNLSLTDVVSLKISARPLGTIIDLKDNGSNYTPFKKEVSVGDYWVTLTKSGYYSQKHRIHVDGSHTDFNYKMKRIFFKKSGLYLEGVGQAGSLMAYGGTLGFYIKNINVEGSYLMGASDSDLIWWNDKSAVDNLLRPSALTYKATFIGGKIGYGIVTANWLRITPQIGFGVTKLKGEYEEWGSGLGIEETYVASASAGLRIHVPLTSWLGLSISPEYSFQVASGDAYEDMAEVSSTVKSWGSGFNCRVGLNIFF